MIEYFKKFFKGLFGAYDFLEISLAIIFASVIFLAFPYYLIKELLQEGHYFLSIVISIILVFSSVICIRDIRNKKWSGLSICAVALWGVCFLIVIWEMAT